MNNRSRTHVPPSLAGRKPAAGGLEAQLSFSEGEVGVNARELTSAEAARLLNVSRAYVVKLADSGVFGGVRRTLDGALWVKEADVLSYRASSRAKQAAALDELVRETERLGLYEAEVKELGAPSSRVD